jgi:hypothetical protein
LDVNTSNTSSNTSDVLKNGKMYSSVLKDVLDVLFSWQDVLNDVLMIAPGCINRGTGDVLRCIENLQDVLLAVLQVQGRMYWMY